MRPTRKKKPGQDAFAISIISSLQALKDELGLMSPEAQKHWTTLETFCAISLDVLSRAKPQDVRSAVINAELRQWFSPNPQFDTMENSEVQS